VLTGFGRCGWYRERYTVSRGFLFYSSIDQLPDRHCRRELPSDFRCKQCFFRALASSSYMVWL
jgi:hypothetical protein